jgi:SecD/SecF fusion protein
LYLLGSGTVKGFAQTLAIGIVVSLFTALFVTKFILNAFYAIGLDSEKFYGIQKPKVKYFNYVGNGPKFVIASLLVIAIGIGAMIMNKANDGESLAYGLDFKGGTSTQITLPDTVTSDISRDLETLVSSELGVVGEIVSIRDSNSYIIKTTELSQEQAETLNNRLIKDYSIDPELITSESISGTVSGEMTSDAIWAVLIATLCMLLYIWIRFKNIGFATSAIFALLHDVLIVLMVYAVFKITVSSTFIACMLTILGYSINATIIIFDRIRENIKEKLNKDTLMDIVNASIGQTISRSINTSLTTFIMVFALAILGVDSIKEFAIPLMAGIVCGAYSSVCITGALWYFYKIKLAKKA